MVSEFAEGFAEGAEILSDASEALIAALERVATARKVAKDEAICAQGESGDSLYVILAGLFEVSVLSEDGRKITMTLLGPGDVVGEIALFDPGPRTATVTAMEPAEVKIVTRAALMQEMRADSDLALEMVRLAGRKMRRFNKQFEQQVFLSAERRMAAKLLFLDRAMQGDDGRIAISQSELADHVGVTREMVSKTLSDWKKRGLIEVGRGKLRLTDTEGLEDLVHAEVA